MSTPHAGGSRTAIITGGGRGIGRASAIALADDGWNVVVCGRTEETLLETVAALRLLDGAQALAVVADVSSSDDVDHVFARTVATFGRVDLLFNNAGISAPGIPIDELEIDAWERVIAVNVTGSFLCARAAFAQMRHQSPAGGRIINNGSISAETPRPFSAPYTASKHAITGLTKSLALDGRTHGITVGQIDIGNVRTEMTERMASGILQPDGTTRAEAIMDMTNVTDAVLYMANLDADANVLRMTVMASAMPFVGRG